MTATPKIGFIKILDDESTKTINNELATKNDILLIRKELSALNNKLEELTRHCVKITKPE